MITGNQLRQKFNRFSSLPTFDQELFKLLLKTEYLLQSALLENKHWCLVSVTGNSTNVYYKNCDFKISNLVQEECSFSEFAGHYIEILHLNGYVVTHSDPIINLDAYQLIEYPGHIQKEYTHSITFKISYENS